MLVLSVLGLARHDGVSLFLALAMPFVILDASRLLLVVLSEGGRSSVVLDSLALAAR